MLKAIDNDDDEIKDPIYEEIVFLLKKDGLPLDYTQKGVSKSKMVREFLRAKHVILKQILIFLNLSHSKIQQAIDQ